MWLFSNLFPKIDPRGAARLVPPVLPVGWPTEEAGSGSSKLHFLPRAPFLPLETEQPRGRSGHTGPRKGPEQDTGTIKSPRAGGSERVPWGSPAPESWTWEDEIMGAAGPSCGAGNGSREVFNSMMGPHRSEQQGQKRGTMHNLQFFAILTS